MMKVVNRLVWFFFIFQGISFCWRYAEMSIYGTSQASIIDALVAVFIAAWLSGKGEERE